uniref:Uncharacterized protein n=1 Tax=Lepeophtheirus salmonis TaxID=72036 RepID=A0A0K2V0Q5_LEPSM
MWSLFRYILQRKVGTTKTIYHFLNTENPVSKRMPFQTLQSNFKFLKLQLL